MLCANFLCRVLEACPVAVDSWCTKIGDQPALFVAPVGAVTNWLGRRVPIGGRHRVCMHGEACGLLLGVSQVTPPGRLLAGRDLDYLLAMGNAQRC